MLLRDRPIRRKLTTIILLTSGAVLLLTCAAFFAYELLTFPQTAVRNLSTLGEIIAANSTAALAFKNQDDAKEILGALKAERHIVAAGLYDQEGKLFSKYPADLPAGALPTAPGNDGYRFERSHLAGFQPVEQGGNKRLGTLYLKSNMEAMYERFRLYGTISLLAIAVSLLVAYALSRVLQQQISRPILALAETARAVSDRRDYSVRATKLGQDEVGLLTDAFNHMLTQIHGQNQALRESEERLRGILNSALSAVVVIDAAGRVIDWNPRAENMFGWTRAEAAGQKLAEIIIPPQYREAHERGLAHYLATGEGPVLNRLIELSALRRDGSEFPIELSISPQKTGDVVTFCGFITDITERKRAEQRQTAQHAVTRILSEAASLAEASPRILQAICEALGWNVGSIWSVDTAARVLRSVEIWHRPSAPVPAFEAVSRRSTFASGVGLPGRVWAGGSPVWIADVVKEGNFPRAPFAVQEGLHAAFGFPIRCGNEITGVIEFFGREIQQPDEDLIKMMATIGSQIGQFAERKRAEEALRESEGLLRAVVETAVDGIITIDERGIIRTMNPATSRIFGYAGNEVVGHNVNMLMPPPYHDEHDSYLANYQRTGQRKIIGSGREVSGRRKDGTTFPLDLAVSETWLGERRIFTGIVRDITERKRMEEVRERFAAIVEQSDDAIVSKTLGGIITSWNAGAQKLFGYSTQEAVGKPMLMLIPTERADEEPDILARITRGQSIDHFETVRVRKDGKLIDVAVTISPIKDGHGKIIGASTIARDITERKVAESRLQAQLGRLDLLHQITRAIGERQDLPSMFQVIVRSLEDNLPIDFGCVCLYDAAEETLTVISVGNGALAAQLALTEGERIAIDEDGLARCVRGQLVYEPDISQVPFPFPQRLAAAGLRSLVAAPVLIEGKVFGVVVAARRQAHGFSSGECEFLRQLSEHVAVASHQARLYGALEEAYHDLRQTQHTVMQQERLRVLGQMASGIAHDINNAISPIALYTESLLEREPGLSDRARDYLTTIQRAIEDVAETVARMREFYRRREPQLALTTIDLNRVARQVIDLTRARWSNVPQERGTVIDLKTELASGLPTLPGAESEIRDALTNLIFNAVDAMPQGGTLTVRTRAVARQDERESGAFVHLEVCDTGAGIDEETKRRCLEPFFTTKGERGTGLGLAMVYGMVQRHSAEIEIESERGKGTTVRLIFPSSAAGDAPSVHPARLVRPAQRLRILIVDDDPLLLKSLRDTLEGDGHFVSAADGGQAGIDTFAKALSRGEPFAVVITDLGMPYVDGRKVAASIKSAAPATPVILLTGWGQRLVAENDIPPHVNRVLNKPPKLRELRSTLAELTTTAAQAGAP